MLENRIDIVAVLSYLVGAITSLIVLTLIQHGVHWASWVVGLVGGFIGIVIIPNLAKKK